MRYFQRRVATAEDAEELTQEVFVRLLRRDNINTIQNIEGFVFITAANLLKDHYRYRARRGGGKTASIENLQIRSADPNPGQVVEDRDEISVLMHAIEELPPKCRAVFTMFRFEEIPQAEIARRLHIAAAMIALKKRLRAANDERGLAKTDRRHD
jgi:RNA polymerase sigma-70 factor (ECF subfamily)